MKIKIILTQLLLIVNVVSFAQFYSKPKEPTFNYMTINLTTGNPTLFWSAPKYDPQYPNPTGYIIYKKMPDQLGNEDYFSIDTVDNSTFSYTDLNANGNSERLYYRIASKGPTDPSRQTLYHANIWITSEYDSCNAVIKLDWESYDGWKNENINSVYNLYMSNSNDISSFTLLDTVNKFDNKYFVNGIKENTDYYFYLCASRSDTTFTTTSNLYYRRSTMPYHPEFITIDSVIAGNKGTEIHYTIDSTTELSNFRLVRWEYPDTNKILFSAKIIEEFSDPHKKVTVDSTDSWAARTRKFYFKIDAINSCKSVVKVSNLCNTIIPQATSNETEIKLEWDELIIDTTRIPSRINNHINYKIFRIAYAQGVDLSDNGEITEIANVSRNSYTDDVSNYRYFNPPYQFTFKYYIEATEHTLLGEPVALSRSRVITTEIIPSIVMPNAIAPSMRNFQYGHSRNIFEPIISFYADYSLTIYDRWGGTIYHGNHGWDGKYPNGEYAKEGTYLYRLEVYTNDSGSVIKKGNVSVVYPEK